MVIEYCRPSWPEKHSPTPMEGPKNTKTVPDTFFLSQGDRRVETEFPLVTEDEFRDALEGPQHFNSNSRCDLHRIKKSPKACLFSPSPKRMSWPKVTKRSRDGSSRSCGNQRTCGN